MLIQVDVDSTLYDADALFSSLAKEAGILWPDRDNQWRPAHTLNFEDGSPCTPDALKKMFRKAHSYEYIQNNVPYEGAVGVLNQLVEDFENIEIAYVSDRNEQQTAALRRWLSDWGFLKGDEAHVVATKDKRDWMRVFRPSIVIDDRVRTMLMAAFELNSRVVSLEHNHNVNLKGEGREYGIYIVKDWEEVGYTLRNEVLPNLDPINREIQYTLK